MPVLGIDLGGTKIAFAIFNRNGEMSSREVAAIRSQKNKDPGILICGHIKKIIRRNADRSAGIEAVGISVPGIYHAARGTVWAPNIPGWEEYPLLAVAKEAAGDIPVVIDSDRACSIMGEVWQGNAKGCRNAVFVAVGTGIGAGILADGRILRGENDISGSAGWMGLDTPYLKKYSECGFFEYHSSGEGIARIARNYCDEHPGYNGMLRKLNPQEITAGDVFEAYRSGDAAGTAVIQKCINYWGMAVANIISLFNPQKIILGGGVFGPAAMLIPAITEEAFRWAQPVSMKLATVEQSALGPDAGVYGAAYMALNKTTEQTAKNSRDV